MTKLPWRSQGRWNIRFDFRPNNDRWKAWHDHDMVKTIPENVLVNNLLQFLGWDYLSCFCFWHVCCWHNVCLLLVGHPFARHYLGQWVASVKMCVMVCALWCISRPRDAWNAVPLVDFSHIWKKTFYNMFGRHCQAPESLCGSKTAGQLRERERRTPRQWKHTHQIAEPKLKSCTKKEIFSWGCV